MHAALRPRRPSGRVDATRTGNTFDREDARRAARSRCCCRPTSIDFDAPVQVTVNGAPALDGVVKRDLAALLRWAARDNDRTMLYGAELHVTVP